jgi:small subunit ribosomal protein S17
MKIFTGEVISTKMARTATVRVNRIVAHPIYKKRIKLSKKYHVHDDLGGRVGDTVRFAASAPKSKLKKWKTVEIVDKNKNKKTK